MERLDSKGAALIPPTTPLTFNKKFLLFIFLLNFS